MALKYIGRGEYLIGVPARDLTDEEVAKLGGADWLIDSGLYMLPPKPAAESKQSKQDKES